MMGHYKGNGYCSSYVLWALCPTSRWASVDSSMQSNLIYHLRVPILQCTSPHDVSCSGPCIMFNLQALFGIEIYLGFELILTNSCHRDARNCRAKNIEQSDSVLPDVNLFAIVHSAGNPSDATPTLSSLVPESLPAASEGDQTLPAVPAACTTTVAFSKPRPPLPLSTSYISRM